MINIFQWAYFCKYVVGPRLVVGHLTHCFPNAASILTCDYLNHAKRREISSKWKGKLLEYFEFCDQEYQNILKHVFTHWLSLEHCIERALKKFPSLKTYFLSESFAAGCIFKSPVGSCPVLFHSASIQSFTEFNKFLQRSKPTIHVL